MIDILKVTLADNMKARELMPDGAYQRLKPTEGAAPLRSQLRFLELAAESIRPQAIPEPEPAQAPPPRVAKRTKKESARRSPGTP